MRFSAARLQQVCAIACVLSAQVAVAAAPNVEPTGALTLAQAIDAAISRNSELHAGSYELKAADARITQARLRPNPEASLEIDGIASGASQPYRRRWVATLSGNRRCRAHRRVFHGAPDV